MPVKRIFTLAILSFCLVLGLQGCASKYIVMGEDGRRISLSELDLVRGETPFERSLYESYDDLYDPVKVQQYLMFDLLKGYAEHDGSRSPKGRLFGELKNLHVVYDSSRVAEVFHEGLADLDQSWGGHPNNLFIDEEVAKRAEQILRYQCFNPESDKHFDDFGWLIACHGPCEILTWTETTVTASFSNGVVYLIGEDNTMGHIILRAVRNEEVLSTLSSKAASNLGLDEQQVPKEEPLGDVSQLGDVGLYAESKKLEMQQQGKVSVEVDYHELEFSSINLHAVPASYGNGMWNGKVPAEGEGPWNWTRAFLDCYVNLDALGVSFGKHRKRLDLEIEYELIHRHKGSFRQVAGETMSYQKDASNLTGDEGLAFRVFTAPFSTDNETDQGYYQLNVRITDDKRVAIRKLPFHVREGAYEFLVLEEEASLDAGIPRCQRLPGARTGEWLNYLVPIKDLPRCGSGKGFCGKIDIYLRSNEFAREGRVTVSRSWPFEQIESGAISLEDLTGPEAQQGAQASLVASQEIMATNPSLYFIGRIKIPKFLSDGTRVTRGMYSIAAVVTSGDKVVAEAIMNDLSIH